MIVFSVPFLPFFLPSFLSKLRFEELYFSARFLSHFFYVGIPTEHVRVDPGFSRGTKPKSPPKSVRTAPPCGAWTSLLAFSTVYFFLLVVCFGQSVYAVEKYSSNIS